MIQDMTYDEYIQNILDTRGRFNCGDKYHERHHIVLKSCGGSNDLDNLIDLYAKEHFIAHKLLAEENPDNLKIVCAYTCMAFLRNDYEHRYELTPDEYEEARIVLSKTMSENRKGDKNPMYGMSGENSPSYGKKHSEETREKMKRNHADFRGNKHGNYGKHPSAETRQKMKESAKARCTEEWRQNVKQRMKERLANPQNHPRTRSVVQLSSNGEFIKEYWGAKQAEQETGIHRSNITACCKNKPNFKTAGGFKWMYKEEYDKLTIQNDYEVSE